MAYINSRILPVGIQSFKKGTETLTSLGVGSGQLQEGVLFIWHTLICY